MATFTVHLETDNVGSRVAREVEIDDDELEGLTGRERDTYIHDHLKDELFEMYEWGWDEKASADA